MTKLTPACRSDNMAANVVATAEQHVAGLAKHAPGSRVTVTGEEGVWVVVGSEENMVAGTIVSVRQGDKVLRPVAGRLKGAK